MGMVINPSKYCQEAVRICEEYVVKHLTKVYRLSEKAENPFPMGYYPEFDVSPVLWPDEASCYQFLKEVMRWMVEIGHIDINTKVSLLSLNLAMPIQGHLGAVLYVLGYLKVKHNSQLAFDLTYPEFLGMWWDRFLLGWGGRYPTQCSIP